MPLSVTNIGSNTGVAVNTVAVTVPAGGVPAGALIVVCVSDNSVAGTGGLNAVADTGGNTYAVAVQANNNNAAANGCGIMYTANVKTALVNTNTITYTLGTVTSSAAVSAFYIKGAPTLIEAKNSATGSSATPSVTSGTPSVVGDLFIGMVSGTTLIASFTQDSTNAAWASPPGQVSIAAPPLGGGNVVNSGAGTRTYAPTFGTSDTWAALIMGVQGTVSGWEVKPPEIQTFPTTKQRYTAAKGKSGFAFFPPWKNMGWEPNLPTPLIRPPVVNQKAGAILRGDDGIQARWIREPPRGWEPNLPQPLKQPPVVNQKAAAVLKGDEGIQARKINFFPTGWEIQPLPPPHIFIEKRGAILRGDDGTEGKFINFFPSGWEIQPWQPPFFPTTRLKYAALSHPEEGVEAKFIPPSINPDGWEIQAFQPSFFPTTKQKYSALSHPEEGIEFPLVNFFPAGWEIQSPQPPFFPKTSQKIAALSQWEDGIEAKYVFISSANWFEIQPTVPKISYKSGAWSQKEDGIEFPFIRFFPGGWEIQPVQPPVFPSVRQRYLGTKGKSEFGVYSLWQNFGWEIQSVQPPTYPTIQQRTGAFSHPEDGIEAKYIFVSPTINWSFDIQQSPLKINYRSGAWSQKEDRIESPYVNWKNFGWEIQPWQPLFSPKINQKSSILRGIDGTEGKFINFFPAGWEIQSVQPPNYPKTNLKTAALSQWEDGIEKPYIFVSQTINWSFDIQPTLSKIYYRSGAWSHKEDGIESPFINFLPYGWEIQSVQPPNYPKTSQRYLGTKGKYQFGIFSPWFNFGWEIQSVQPPFFPKTNQKSSILRGDDGTEGQFINFLPYGWEIQSVQPPFFPKTNQKIAALSQWEDGIEGIYVFVPTTPAKWGWEPLPLQLRQLTSNRYFGIEGKSEFASFTFQPYGWEIQPYQPPHIFIEKKGLILRGIDGIEGKFINFFPSGWEIQPVQPPHPKPEVKAAAILRGDDGIEFPLIRFFPAGWEIPSPQPPFFLKTNQKIGATSQWEDGVEAPFIFVPPGFVQWGYEHQMFPWVRPQRNPVMNGDDGIEYPFINWKNMGWEIQPVQPPHMFIEKKGLILRGIDGIEGKFIKFLPAGWEIQPPQPPFFPTIGRKFGALSHPEEGIEGVYIFVATNLANNPLGWIVQPWQPPFYPSIHQRFGALSHPEEGIEGPYIFVAPTKKNFEFLIKWRRRGRR